MIGIRNTELFNLIADVIEEHPELHNQDEWIAEDSMYELLNEDEESDSTRTVETAAGTIHCGSAQCVAGWVFAFNDQLPTLARLIDQNRTSEVETRAADMLGITRQEGYALFNHLYSIREFNWPAALRGIANGEDVIDALESPEYNLFGRVDL